MTRMSESAAPKLGIVDTLVSMDLDVPANANGVLYAVGGFGGGLTLYVKEGVLTYEFNQFEVEKESMGDALNFLEDGLSCEITFYDGRAISVELPNTVVREIAYTEPAVKGDTSGKVTKPAKLATGYEVAVPLFVSTGDRIEVDTRTGEYKRRV